MTLSLEEKQRIVDIASGTLIPDTGMEKHFVMVVNGKGRACSPKEKEWFAYWDSYSISDTTSEEPGVQPATPSEVQSVASAPSPFGDLDTSPDFSFEDEVIIEEVREKLTNLLNAEDSYELNAKLLEDVKKLLSSIHGDIPLDIVGQMKAVDLALAPF